MPDMKTIATTAAICAAVIILDDILRRKVSQYPGLTGLAAQVVP